MDLYTRELDLHQMTVLEARQYLKAELNGMPKYIKEVQVIHGYSRGKALQKFLRNEFSHKRVERKVIGLNQGMTTLILKS